jgi:hypothetical protein
MVGGCKAPASTACVSDCCPICRVSANGSTPAGYERERLQNFYAQTEPLPEVVPIRIVRSCTLAGRAFAVGTAIQAGTWAPAGFVFQYAPAAEASSSVLPTTLALECTTLIGTARLRFPSAIVPRDGCTQQTLIIVGQGDLEAPDGSIGELLPTVAIVTVSSAGIGAGGSCSSTGGVPPLSMCVVVQTGAGPTALPDEVYVDACLSPPVGACDQPDTFFVCGHATVDGQRVATFRKLALNGLLPVILADGMAVQQFNAPPHDTEFVDAVGVSVAASCALGFILVGVQLRDAGSTDDTVVQSCVWTLALDGVPLSSLTLAGFNSPLTQQLALPLSTSGAAIIKVLIAPDGAVFCVASARAPPTSASLPPSIVAVYAFKADTSVDVSYGVGGIALWFTDAYGSARPNDAHLFADGAVGVLGNCFAFESAGDGVDYTRMVVGALPWLNVQVSNLAGPPTPVPFLLRFSACAGVPCLRLLGVPGCPCSAFAWASTFAPGPYGIGTGVLVLGDCAQAVLSTSPVAGVLTLELVFGPANNVRAANCSGRRAPLLDADCSGLVTLDTRCAPTTLVVPGGIVLGDSSVALPGTLRYTQANGLQLFTNGDWQTLAFAIL